MEATSSVVSPVEASACSSRRIAAEIVDACIQSGSAMDQGCDGGRGRIKKILCFPLCGWMRCCSCRNY
ncbi:hypothetical protein OIU77_002148 [Salix suchowensis]|uniref:Uncharacterized protein n=1 Tax=Salix suchowensis TaxID=1278906 RepID=A0ABQ9B3S8_9ROSI|nr:hypothetical protein OIU77_002148 [Salix suchowensis]